MRPTNPHLARIHLYTHTRTQDEEEEADDDLEVVDGGSDDEDKDGDDEDPDPHCTINYVANTVYTLIDINAKDAFTDPAPVIPAHLKKQRPGDYVRMKGEDLTLKSNCNIIFEPEQALALDDKWRPFPEDMTAQDLFDLGAHEFHLWWQCIQEPKVKKVPAKAATKTGKKGKQRNR